MKTNKDRLFSEDIFYSIIKKKIALKYMTINKNSPNGLDQLFLRDYVYNLIRNKATIHDSYYCRLFSDSTAWPTQRQGILQLILHFINFFLFLPCII
jgi:hypothetical protein